MAGRPLGQAQNRTFDDAKLASMEEPLTVRIEKKKGSTRTPIPMPPSEDGRSPGTGLSKEDVRQIESWLVNEWAGGGYYEITVTDSSSPTPLTMKWEPFWNPNEYPEKMPPPLAEAAAASAAQRPSSVAAPIPQAQVVRQMATPAFPGGFPPGLPAPQQQQAAPAPQPFYGYGAGFYNQPYQQPQPQQQQFQAWQQAEAERRRTEDERQKAEDQRRLLEESQRKLQAELQAAKEAAMRRDYEAQLERERSAANERVKAVEQQMTEMRSMISNLTQSIQQGSQKPNAELEALKEANRLANERIERERAEREAERREREMRDAMRLQFEQTQKQIEMMQRQMQENADRIAREAANTNRGPDPLILMMQEQNRLQVEALKESQRTSLQQMQQMQGFMMRPQDMLMLTKESQTTVDATADRLARHYGGVMDLQTRLMEQAMQLAPQGSGAADMIREGLSNVKDLAERYVGAQQAKAQVAAQAQVEMAKQQVRAMEIETQARNPQPQPQVVYAPPPPRVEAQLSGATMTPKKNKKAQAAQATTAAPDMGGPKRLGRTDFEWFGPLLTEVLQLREGVDRYIESLSQQPVRLKDGQPDGISVEQAAMGIVTAMGIVAQNQLPIPAMVDLLNQHQYADFMDILLPNAPQPFRDDLVGATIAKLKEMGVDGQAVPATGSDDDDDDDDDDDGVQAGAADEGNPDSDDDNDGKVVAPPPAARARRNGRSAHA